MLTDPKLRSQVDALWDKFWTGGLTNPLDAIEQFSYLLFLKRLDDRENAAERQAKRKGTMYQPSVKKEMRWSHWTQFKAEEALSHLKKEVFPNLSKLADEENSFGEYMKTAECKINKPSLLIEACKLIDQMEISQQNQDVQGDLYEYLLSHLSIAGRNGQFRTPRHIIRMMVQMLDPQPKERIGDQLQDDARRFMKSKKYLRGFDNDSGMTMLRIGSMNLMLHGIQSPQFFYMDTLSKGYDGAGEFDVILMNPPFKGAVDKGDVHPDLPSDTTKSELLFLHLILRALDMGGRAAVIVPDGVLFGSSRAHVEVRKRIIEENRLDGVVSMPSGVFKPYAGVSTAVLFFTRGAQTKDIWFYDMEHDGFSLDDKRTPTQENDISDAVDCWKNRFDKGFNDIRYSRIDELKKSLAPMKAERLKLHEEINRLKFENALDGNSFASLLADAESRLSNIDSRISLPQAELDRLTRQFWVTKEQVKANKYDLSASRYRQVDADLAYHEKPSVTLERLARLESVMMSEIEELKKMMKDE